MTTGRTIGRSVEDEKARYGWVTTSAAAKMIGGAAPVSTNHIIALIEAGELRARNVALPTSSRKEWRVDPASVEEFLDRRTSGAA